MIKHWLLTGDTHGQNMSRLTQIKNNNPNLIEEETAIIILGDSGFNFYLNKTDTKNKLMIKKHFQYFIYCVRGNHEERPENLGYELVWDEQVQGHVYVDNIHNKIRYFQDGGEYRLGEYRVLTIGGAYSVDKYWRLERAAAANSSFTGWFKDEQLTANEMEKINSVTTDKYYDFVFSHTCPYSWRPTDLFLSSVDQSTVDNTMEYWLDELKNSCKWNVWLFAHYHDDRIVQSNVKIMFNNIEELNQLYKTLGQT